jgi:Uma2 family endonuclease
MCVNPNTLVDATVIVEVLSPSTSEFDRAGKFLHFQQLPSLQHYVLVSQDRLAIDTGGAMRPASGKIEVFIAPGDTVRLDAIDCELPLEQVYERLDLDSLEINGRGEEIYARLYRAIALEALLALPSF